MKKIYYLLFFLFLLAEESRTQSLCTGVTLHELNIDFSNTDVFNFPTLDEGEIANGIHQTSGTFGFDILEEVVEKQAKKPGLDDLFISFEIWDTFDPYSGVELEANSTLHQITATAMGLEGRMAMGNSLETSSSTGDVRCYSITVDFATHITIKAEDINVLTSGINSPGSAFESGSIVFKGASGTPYGTAQRLFQQSYAWGSSRQ